MRNLRAWNIAATTVVLGMLSTACSSEDNPQLHYPELASRLCRTKVPTAPIKRIFPGPYKEASQTYSRQDSLTSLKDGRKHGRCTVSLVFEEHSENGRRATVSVEANISNEETPEQLVDGSQDFDLIPYETVRAGKIKGLSGPQGAAVAFPCTGRKDQAKSVEVTVKITSDSMNLTDEREKRITGTISAFAVHTSQILNRTLLHCLDSMDISGAIETKEVKGHPQ